jgi:peptide-methionine (R)-S-oxide reductase
MQRVGLGVVAIATSTRLWAVEKIQRLDSEWRRLLTPDQYYILRDEGTEPSGSSPLDKEYRQGEYRCAGCDLLLFTSAMKYDSGTGWPSFFDKVEGHLETKRDFKLIWPRTEYHCARCGGHQGHVFDDGPKPTGERWCNNGLALRFVPDTEKNQS